jgi:4,5-dihydroxyphthalate decarboxylase
MTGRITLTVACDDYEAVRPLVDGSVRADGLDLVFTTDLSVAERQSRMLEHRAFDVCEFSATTYVLAALRGLPLTALPIFLLRRFRHGDIFVNAAAGIRSPNDLAGKRVGGLSYQVASNVWARGILDADYGVPHDAMTWVVQRDEEIGFDPPPGLRIERASGQGTPDSMLLSGAVDALMLPTVPKAVQEGDPRVRRLFPDYKEVEAAWYRRTGLFPIMHVTAVRRELVERHPWIPARLRNAFDAAKQVAYRRMANVRVVPLAWFGAAWEEERRLLGPDPWRHGLDGANAANLEMLLRSMRRQGLIARTPALDALFVDAPPA